MKSYFLILLLLVGCAKKPVDVPIPANMNPPAPELHGPSEDERDPALVPKPTPKPKVKTQKYFIPHGS